MASGELIDGIGRSSDRRAITYSSYLQNGYIKIRDLESVLVQYRKPIIDDLPDDCGFDKYFELIILMNVALVDSGVVSERVEGYSATVYLWRPVDIELSIYRLH